MYKAKRFIIGGTLLALALISNVGLACNAEPSPVPPLAPTTPPASVPSPPSLQLMESGPEIPANYTTYTDEAKAFSISYPSDWEPYMTAKHKKDAKEFINDIQSGLPIEKGGTIFLAGRLRVMDVDPSIYIRVEPMPEGVSTYDQMVEAQVTQMKMIVEDDKEFSRVKTTIDGREATIVDYEGPVSGGFKCHFHLMITLVGKTAWIVNCSSCPVNSSIWENDFDAIVRSLRIYD